MRRVALLLPSLLLILSLPLMAYSAEDEKVYFYGYAPVPSRETFGIGAGYAYLDIIGIEDDTHVRIYDLRSGELLGGVVVDRMQLYNYRLPLETYFKVEADKMVSVSLSAGTGLGPWGIEYPPSASAFYPSVDGGFAGKELVFMAFETQHGALSVYAVEDSQVTIYNSTGVVSQLSLKAYSAGAVQLKARSVYRLVSTGRVIVENAPGWTPALTYAPSVTGGFVGNMFSIFYMYDHRQDTYPLTVVAQERCDVRVYEIGPAGIGTHPSTEMSLNVGENKTFSERRDVPVVVYATGRVMIRKGPSPIHESGGLSFMGLKAGEEAWLQVPDGGGIIFTSKPTSLTVDDEPLIVSRDGMEPVSPGLHHIETNETVVVEVYSSSPPEYAAYIVSPQGLEVSYPAPPPLPAAGDPTIYYAGAAAAAVVVAAFASYRRLRRAR